MPALNKTTPTLADSGPHGGGRPGLPQTRHGGEARTAQGHSAGPGYRQDR